MNATTQAIINRLPKKPLLMPSEISDAYGLKTSDKVLSDIKTGRLAANKVGGKYIVSREAAEDYIESNEYIPDEGTL